MATERDPSEHPKMRTSRAEDAARSPRLRQNLGEVTAALLLCYFLLLIFGARQIFNWSSKLPHSEWTQALTLITEEHWQAMDKLGLDEPVLSLERDFLSFQNTPKHGMPKKYQEFVAARAKSAETKRLRALGKAPPDSLWAVTKDKQREIWRREARQNKSHRGPRILLVGDSMMLSIGPVIKKDISERLGGSVDLRARVATGLARPDVFDWQREIEDALSTTSYDAVVMMMGTNDSQDFAENGQVLTYGTREWVKIYNARLTGLMDSVCRGAPRGIWIGMPPMQEEAFDRKMSRINTWALRESGNHGCMKYLGLDGVIGDASGKFSSFLAVEDDYLRVRTADGIHVSNHGGKLIANALLPLLARVHHQFTKRK